MRRSTRANAAMKNFKFRLDDRIRSAPDKVESGLVTRDPSGAKVVDPALRAQIDAAVARRFPGKATPRA